jgi:hypothetical protein
MRTLRNSAVHVHSVVQDYRLSGGRSVFLQLWTAGLLYEGALCPCVAHLLVCISDCLCGCTCLAATIVCVCACVSTKGVLGHMHAH